MLSIIDVFIQDYFPYSLPDPTLYTQFHKPLAPAKPSIITQITNSEITINPHLRALE
jgi:hypothetical protein